nr:hypothetical protein [Tanacetum cinerariifolium]
MNNIPSYFITFLCTCLSSHKTHPNQVFFLLGDKLIIVDVLLERLRHRREAVEGPRILWKNLNGEAVETFRATVFERLAVEDMSASNADQMWNTPARVMKDAAKDSLGPDQIPIEAWRCLGDEGVKWLTCLFNKIFSSAKILDEWRLSEVIPVYKNKGDAQACSNYRGIKLLSHTMKL